MTANVVKGKVSRTMVPKELMAEIDIQNCNESKNVVTLYVYGPEMSVQMYNTQWDGGTRNTYRGFNTNTLKGHSHDSISDIIDNSGDTTITIFDSFAVIECSVFCGKVCNPTIHIRDCDLIKLFGNGDWLMGHPALAALPSVLQADMLDEIADTDRTHEAKRMRKTALALRKANGI